MKEPLIFKRIKDHLLNILYPLKCLGCENKNEILCQDCIVKMTPAERETRENIVALFDYRDLLVQKAIWELKYHHKRYLGEKLGELLYEFLIEDISDLKAVSGKSIYVVPVPISSKKIKLRGYNQASHIAKGFCSKNNKNILELKNNLIYKKFDTLPQAKITSQKKTVRKCQRSFWYKKYRDSQRTNYYHYR